MTQKIHIPKRNPNPERQHRRPGRVNQALRKLAFFTAGILVSSPAFAQEKPVAAVQETAKPQLRPSYGGFNPVPLAKEMGFNKFAEGLEGKKPKTEAKDNAEKGVTEAKNADLSGLGITVTNKVSFEDLKKWDAETATYRLTELNDTRQKEAEVYFATSLSIPVEGKEVPLLVNFLKVFQDDPRRGFTKGYVGLSFGYPENKDAKIVALGGYDLTKLDAAYKKATGSELKYVRLIVEKGDDATAGKYLTVYVVPVDQPNGVIKQNTIVFGFSFAMKTQQTGNDYLVVASK